MVNLYIFNESNRAAVYGIGTYIRELTNALKKSDINVCVVHLRSEKLDEETAEMNGIHHWSLPPPISQYISSDWNRQNELYHQNIVYLLRLQIKNTDNLVFHNSTKIACFPETIHTRICEYFHAKNKNTRICG